MPKNSIDYSKYSFYKIVCNDLNIKDCYVGSTAHFTSRKANHKMACNVETNPKHNYKIYQIIRNNGGWSNWSMILIDKVPCANGEEARKKERELYEQLNATMNNNIPNRTHQEYLIENKEIISDRMKEYYQKNKETILEKKKEYYEKNKEIIKEKRLFKNVNITV
jgi:hypothetical protein